jgi:hypothetical protein
MLQDVVRRPTGDWKYFATNRSAEHANNKNGARPGAAGKGRSPGYLANSATSLGTHAQTSPVHPGCPGMRNPPLPLQEHLSGSACSCRRFPRLGASGSGLPGAVASEGRGPVGIVGGHRALALSGLEKGQARFPTYQGALTVKMRSLPRASSTHCRRRAR